ncbi:alpha-galactosidase D [Ktedonospora formicarum]
MPRFLFALTILLVSGSLLVISAWQQGRPSVAHAASNVTNGLAQKPYMGWSSWSLESTNASGYGTNWLTEANVKAQADALHQKLQGSGYQYINIDAGWWMDYSWTPTFDSYGRPAPFPGRFPSGIAAVADYVHHYGLKFGIYYGAGLDFLAYDNNYPIYGTNCHTQDIAVQPLTKTNGWQGAYAIDYSKPCAQAYIDSIADQFASWGVDFMKLDGVTPGSFRNGASSSDNRLDVQAWSQALYQTGRPIQFVISWSLDHDFVHTWQQNSNGWRIDTDVECYCNTLVTWDNSVKQRFTDVVPWISDAKPGGWNNLDSLDVGVGNMDGLTNDERQTYMTLWAIEAAPLYTGDDLTKLDDYGLSLLTNKEVIAIDQAGRPAKPVAQSSNQQVWYAKNADGSYTVALFNLDSTTETVTTNWGDLGFVGMAHVRDAWAHKQLGQFKNSFSATLPAHGSRLLTIQPDATTPAPPPPAGKVVSYEAEATTNTIGGGAVISDCSTCSGGQKVGYLGGGGFVQFNNVTATSAGSYDLTVYYVDGDGGGRPAYLSFNGGSGVLIDFHGNGNWGSVQSMQIRVKLQAGNNTIKFDNSKDYAPDIDRIVVSPIVKTTSYEAEAPGNTLSGGASVANCSDCSGGQKVGNLLLGSSMQFNAINVTRAGTYNVTLYYVDGSSGRSLNVSANGGPALTIYTNGTNDNNWNVVQSVVIQLDLKAGTNTVLFSTTSSMYGADIDHITV